MKIRIVAIAAILLAAVWAQAQAPASPTPPPERKTEPGMMRQHGGIERPRGDIEHKRGSIEREEREQRGGMKHSLAFGKWWKNPEIAQKLKLTDAQISQLDKTFVEHRLKLIDYGAEMEKTDLKLQTLLDADDPNEAQVSAQVDQVLAARGKLERESTMMNLDLRKVLSLEQWKQLKAIRGGDSFGNKFFFKQPGPMGALGKNGLMGPEDTFEFPAPPPDADDLF